MKNLVIFCPYPFDEAPSQRFRFEQYLGLLAVNGFKFTLLPFYNQSALNAVAEKNSFFAVTLLIRRVAIQFFRIPYAFNADFVFIHREIIPFGPPVIEWFLVKVLRKKIIYDFDDAIWLTDKTNEGRLEKKLRWRSKVSQTCRWSHKVSCGNEYLCSYARRFSDNVVLNPTTIDTEKLHNRTLYRDGFHSSSEDRQVTIGWTGSHSTLKYLEGLELVLQRIEEKYPHVSMLVIADKPPKLKLEKLVYRPWSKETEIEDLCHVDIGIMPLPDDEWAKGKCGFKALQYMALCIPALVSPVGVNTKIVTPGINGYWCKTDKEWLDNLILLIEDATLRKSMGQEGRKAVEGQYSVLPNGANFLSLFN